MCKTTTPPRTGALDAIRKDFPPNTSAGAVKPLQSYLKKYVDQFSSDLIPATRPALPTDVDPNAYTRVAFSVLPLLDNAISPYYAGIFDDDTDFSASLVKVAALYTAGELLAAAKAALPGAASETSFLSSFNAALQADINANADQRIRNAHYPQNNLPIGLLPKTREILKLTGFDAGGSPSVDFSDTFKANQSLMIIESDDPAAAFCIDKLGYGYISAALVKKNFFDPSVSTGIWLGGDYANSTPYVRIPCVNDHPDAQLTTTRQMCRLFSLIQLAQVPEADPATNSLMRSLLGQAGSWLTSPGQVVGVKDVGVGPQFTTVLAKIGRAGLGTIQKPDVFSEGLVIQWGDTSQLNTFNDKIDPGSVNPSTRLSGKFAVCWQNLLATIVPAGFDGVIEVLNNTISDFLLQV